MRKEYSKEFFTGLLKDAIKRGKQTGCENLTNALVNITREWYDFEICKESFCCGVMTFGELSGEESLYELVKAIAQSYDKANIWKYYSIYPRITDLLKSIGFKVDRVFRNPNSGNMITELTYDATKEGELWWPTSSDMKDALGAAVVTRAESILTGRNTASPVKTTKRRRI